MKLSVIGCGYVGLVTGSCLAAAGHEVVATDNDVARIAALQAGKIPIYEPNLDKLLEGAVRAGRLRFTSDCAESVRAGDAVFICVGTPPLESGEADLSAIDNVARLIATESKTPKLIIEKSTVPAQTGQQLQRALAVYCAPQRHDVFASRPIPNSFVKARPSWTSFIRTASSLALKRRKRNNSFAKSTSRSWKGASSARYTRESARLRQSRSSW